MRKAHSILGLSVLTLVAFIALPSCDGGAYAQTATATYVLYAKYRSTFGSRTWNMTTVLGTFANLSDCMDAKKKQEADPKSKGATLNCTNKSISLPHN
jgi:hypothetical protein